jgi:hypothetical protein
MCRQVSSPFFNVDDLMVYCNDKFSSLESLKELFTIYVACSIQIINTRKSFIHARGISHNRLGHTTNLLGFTIGNLPFTYLGATIFKGRPKVSYFQPIVDKFKSKLPTWKDSTLSNAWRVQVVNLVVQIMILHTQCTFILGLYL